MSASAPERAAAATATGLGGGVAPWLVPSIADVFFVAILLFCAVVGGRGLLGDGDTGYHVRVGELILRTGAVPRVDPFSFHVPALPWVAHEWLAELLMALVHRPFGLTGVVVLFSLLIALTGYLLHRRLRAETDNLLCAAAATILALGTTRLHWLARPHVFSLLLLIPWCAALDRYRRDGRARALWWLPLALVPWINLHGGAVVALAILGAHLVGSAVDDRARTRGLAWVTVASLVAVSINPQGPAILVFPFRLTAARYVMDNVAEFLSPDFHRPMVFEGLLLVLLAALGRARRRRLAATDLLLVLGLLHMALFAVRYVVVFAIVLAPLLARQLDALVADGRGRLAAALRVRGERLGATDRATRGVLWPALAASAVLLLCGRGALRWDFDPEKKPTRAVAWMLAHGVEGHGFASDEFGDLLIYQTWPRYQVYIDGRLDMYGERWMRAYRAVTGLEPGWQEALRREQVRWILFDAGAPLSRHLETAPGWRRAYADDVAALFLAEGPAAEPPAAPTEPSRPLDGRAPTP